MVETCDEKSLENWIVLETHPVRNDCNSMTSYWALLYEDVWIQFQSGQFELHPQFTTSYLPQGIDVKNEVIHSFKKLKFEKN